MNRAEIKYYLRTLEPRLHFNFEYLVSIMLGEIFALIAFISSLYIAREYSGVIAIVVAEGVMAAMFYIFSRVRLNSINSKAGF